MTDESKFNPCAEQSVLRPQPTGRLSSKGPNIQNIPIRTPEGQKIRKAFIESMERDPENDAKEVILPPGTDPFEAMLIGKAFKVKIRKEVE